MIRNKRILWIALFFVICTGAAGQNSQVMYYMNIPQNHLLNPALRSTNSAYIGFPGLTSVNINIDNNFLNFSDVFLKGKQSSDSILAFLHSDFNVDRFISKLREVNSIEPEVSIQLFGAGFSIGKDLYAFVDVIDRVEGNIFFPKALFELGFKGNDQFFGTKVDLSALSMDVRYFREIGMGFSKNFSDRLRIGVKGKLLFGIATASLKTNQLSITPVDDFSHTFDTDMELNISGPVSFVTDSENHIEDVNFDETKFDSRDGIQSFLTNTSNPGFGLDIGAEYKILDRLTVSAAVTDIGFIKWKTDLSNVYIRDQVEFGGLNMEEVYDGTITIDELFESLGDTLDKYMTLNNSPDPFKTVLPMGVTVGGKFDITNRISIGLLSSSKIIGDQIKQSVTLSGNVNIWNALMASLSYTASNNRYDNLGAGIALRGGFFQFYAVADRIPVIWSKVSEPEGSYSLPATWSTLHARIGINLVFGNRGKKRD